MKKVMMTAGLILLLLPTSAQAAESVNVTLPVFDVTLNGIKAENSISQYPFLVYKDITYVPMTYADARLLGLSTQWTDADGLMVNQSTSFDQVAARDSYTAYTTDSTNEMHQQAAIAEFTIQVNSQAIDNQTEEYPLLIFHDVTYFPLTWRFAVDEFSWQYTFDSEKGLVINPPSRQQPVYSAGSDLPEELRVTGNVVNIRTGASTDAEVTAKVSEGDTVMVLAIQGEWYQVLTDSGQIGWIAGWWTEPVTGSQTAAKNSLTISPIVSSEQMDSFSLQIGEGSEVKISTASTVQLVLTVSHNTIESFQPQAGSGLIQNVTALAAGSKAQVNITTIPGTICTVKQTDGYLLVTARSHTNDIAGLAGKIIVLDPGHGNLKENGSIDPGTVGLIKGFTDRAVADAVTAKLKPMLEAQGAIVYLTRDITGAAQPLTLVQRTELANTVNADVFVSIHGNALENNTVKNGAEIHYWGSTHLTPSAQRHLRLELAQAVNSAILQSTGRDSVIKESNFAVLRENDCPSILVETGYLSNAEDEALLASEEYQQKIAQGILNGLQTFLQ